MSIQRKAKAKKLCSPFSVLDEAQDQYSLSCMVCIER